MLVQLWGSVGGQIGGKVVAVTDGAGESIADIRIDYRSCEGLMEAGRHQGLGLQLSSVGPSVVLAGPQASIGQ